MYKKIFTRLSAAISPTQEERKYVLEDVFWVPECNSSARHLNLPASSEDGSKGPRHPQNLKRGETESREWEHRIVE